MHPMEQIIGDAMMGGAAEKDLALARIACNAFASSRMVCKGCGAVLDQRRVTVVEAQGGCAGLCTGCTPADDPRWAEMAAAVHKSFPGATVELHTWDGTRKLA